MNGIEQGVVPESPWGPIYAITELGSKAGTQYRQNAEQDSMKNMTPEELDIVKDCADLGWKINSVWDIVAAWTLARKALFFDERLLPILGKHLQRGYSDKVLEGLVLAVSDKSARPYVFDSLVNIFRHYAQDDPAISPIADFSAQALVEMAVGSDVDALKQLATSHQYGTRRHYFLPIISKYEKSRAIPFLRALLHEQANVAIAAADELSKLDDYGSRENIAKLLDHEESWVRRKVRKVLKRLEKADKHLH